MPSKKFKIDIDLDQRFETLIAIISSLPTYKICYSISKLLDIELQVAETGQIPLEYFWKKISKPVKSAIFDFMKWQGTKNKSIYIYPNTQTVELYTDNTLTLFEQLQTTNLPITLFPKLKHIDYIIHFEGYKNEEIDDIFKILKESAIFQLVSQEKTNSFFYETLMYCYNQ